MKMFQKILVIALISMLMFTLMPVISSNAVDVGNTISQMNGSKSNITDNDTTPFITLGDTILTFLQILSGIAAVIMIAISGFRYIVETPEVKGEIKKTMLPIVIGIILVFAAVSIAKFFLGMFKNVGA